MKPPIVLYEPARRQRPDYRIGLSAWTDRSMLEEGEFEERLWWYSRFFDTVEVNSTFYALPSPNTAVRRSPAYYAFAAGGATFVVLDNACDPVPVLWRWSERTAGGAPPSPRRARARCSS